MPSPDSLTLLLGLALVLFVSTNIDDVVLLVALLANPGYRAREVVAGQVLGIGALYAASVVASRVSVAIAPGYIAWLGLIPIALGVKALIEQWRGGDADDDDEKAGGRRPASSSPLFRALAVAGVTVANGGDNLGVYIPVFSTQDFASLAIIGIVFAVMTVALCVAGNWLVNHSAFSEQLRRYAGRCVPFVLIAIGAWILAEPHLG